MIFTERKITVRKGKSSIDEPVILYRGDYEVELRFTIMESKYRFKSGVNLVDSEKASHAQLALLAPDGTNVFTEVGRCEDGTAIFVLSKEMIDELSEVGLYSFQIRLFDYYMESRITIPPVELGIEVREPIAAEDHINAVDDAMVGYSIAKTSVLDEPVPETFDNNGQYNKTDWETGDRISEGKLNKIEDALDQINQNEKNDVATLDKRVTNNFNALNSTKANKNDIFSMANMGQDVKEAMTGGSVAVVGNNAILTNNILDGQVTPEKLAMSSGSLTVYTNPEILTIDTSVEDKKVKISGVFIAHAFDYYIQLPSTEYVIKDGCYLILDYKAKTISSIPWSDFKTQNTNEKYILFSNFNGKLQSPIPLYQGILDDIYNKIEPEKLTISSGSLTVYNNPEILTTDTSVGGKKVKISGLFIAHAFDYYIQLPSAEYDIEDGCYLILDYKAKTVSSIPWKSFKTQSTNEKYILFSNFDGKLQSPIPLYQGILDDIYRPTGNTGLEAKGVITVAKEGGQFTSISDAVANANSSSDNPVTIMVYPGVYNESVNVKGDKHISIIGMNKLTCILRNDTGQYANAPLEIQGNAYVANMTIIATHDDDTTTNVDSLRAYAVHADYAGEGTCEFNNCVMISKQNAALGSGLHTNQILKIINCELYSETPTESSMTQNGALFVHDGKGATNQKLIVKNSIIKSLHGCSHYLNGVFGTDMTACFYNNIFWCDDIGADSIHLDTAGEGISKNIKLSDDSFGNNTDILNNK